MSDLTELGLSSYEERAYRALLSLGPATATRVSEASEVPKGRIYDVCNALAARDLVVVRSGSDPRRYEAVDPDVAVDRLLEERRSELRAERDRYERIAGEVSADLSATVPSESRFWDVQIGTDDAVTAMREQFDRAEESLLSVVGGPYEGSSREAYRAEVDAYADLVRPDLEVKLLATPTLLERQPSAQLRDALADVPTFELRVTTGISLTFDVRDGEAAYLTVPAPFTDGERLGGVVVRDEALAGRLETRFRETWAAAEPAESFVDTGA